jgi:hypothetical protein
VNILKDSANASQCKKHIFSIEEGKIEYGIDIILVCADYEYKYPLLPKLQISEERKRICDLWDQKFWIPDRTLSFVGNPKTVATFILVESQIAYISRVLQVE